MIPRVRFFCDSMLGRLARSLRFCGYSCEYRSSLDDSEMVAYCTEHDLVLLTRDTGVMKRRQIARGELRALLVESDFVREQLRQVLDHFLLEPVPQLLCSLCNEPLVPVPREKACGAVPDYVCVTQDEFKRCPACGRFYWKATHWPGIEAIRETGGLAGR